MPFCFYASSLLGHFAPILKNTSLHIRALCIYKNPLLQEVKSMSDLSTQVAIPYQCLHPNHRALQTLNIKLKKNGFFGKKTWNRICTATMVTSSKRSLGINGNNLSCHDDNYQRHKITFSGCEGVA